MTHYLLSVHNDDTPVYPTPEHAERAFAATGRVNDAMREAGVFVFAGGLAASTTARVVRARDGALERTDGPYLESKEHIGGFWVLDVADEAEALAWAERATVACEGAVEVRPFQGVVGD
ncbi:YciI family protein [Longivirga aurantiaca]|uniref:YciI family protein n=1 Tax=Longivirga aurantiaca TaxID=1837743 RepID=A0ABW1T5A4_9ACTN